MTHDNNALAQQSLAERLMIARGIIEADVEAATDADWEGLSRTALEAIDEVLRQPAPASGEVGELVEWLRKFGQSPNCTIEENDKLQITADMIERLAGPVQGEPKQCFTCNGRTFAKVHGQENAYRCVECKTVLAQPTQQPGDQDQVESVAEAIDQWIGDISTSREMARAAMAAMPSGEVGQALPEYGDWLPDVWEKYLQDLVGWEHRKGWAHLPATFRWHEFHERLGSAIAAMPLPTPPSQGEG